MHEKPGEIKKSIIEYLLTQNNGIDEPTLRDYIKRKFDISENKTIKNHLKDLLEQGCIKKNVTSGYSNHWIIEDIENIQNIYEKYTNLHRNLIECTNVILIITNTFSFYENDSINKIDWQKALKIPSFFELLLENNVEDIYFRFSTAYLLTMGEEYTETRRKLDLSRKTLFKNLTNDIIEFVIWQCYVFDILKGRLPTELEDEYEKLIQSPSEELKISHSDEFHQFIFTLIRLGNLTSESKIPILDKIRNTWKLKKLINQS